MTKAQALQQWLSGFLPAYATSNVPEDAVFPWLTYELATGSWESGEVGLTIDLWFYTESEAVPNAKAQEIADAIGMGGCMVAYDGGAMWIKRGSPWCQNVAYDTDRNIKRRYLNISVEYLSQD